MWQLFAAQLSADDGKGHWRPWSSSDHHHKSTAKPTLRVRRERRASGVLNWMHSALPYECLLCVHACMCV
eukprot:scaffold112698_cov24-Tisochrysis_lutea.AAC.1